MKLLGALSWCMLVVLAGSGWGIESSHDMSAQDFLEADRDQDGSISFDEYVSWQERHDFGSRKHSSTSYNALDSNNDGLISSEEIERGPVNLKTS